MSDLSVPVLAVQDLHREFGGVHAVNGASFTVPPGRITGLIGPNGAGKSTALNIIAGALKPSAGTVSYQGKGHHRTALLQGGPARDHPHLSALQ